MSGLLAERSRLLLKVEQDGMQAQKAAIASTKRTLGVADRGVAAQLMTLLRALGRSPHRVRLGVLAVSLVVVVCASTPDMGSTSHPARRSAQSRGMGSPLVLGQAAFHGQVKKAVSRHRHSAGLRGTRLDRKPRVPPSRDDDAARLIARAAESAADVGDVRPSRLCKQLACML